MADSKRKRTPTRRWYLVGAVVVSLFLLFVATNAASASPGGQIHANNPLDTPTNTPTLTPTSTPCPACTPTPTPYSTWATHYIVPEAGAPPNGGTVNIGDRFVLDLSINSGIHPDLTAQQAYITFTNSVLQNARVDQIATSCVPTNSVTADNTVYDGTLENEVCNGPGGCVFRGTYTDPGSIAFASGDLDSANCGHGNGCGGTFRVAQIGFCAIAPGTATLHWQFSPPAPITRDTEILDVIGNTVNDRSTYQNYVINVAGSGCDAVDVHPTSIWPPGAFIYVTVQAGWTWVWDPLTPLMEYNCGPQYPIGVSCGWSCTTYEPRVGGAEILIYDQSGVQRCVVGITGEQPRCPDPTSIPTYTFTSTPTSTLTPTPTRTYTPTNTPMRPTPTPTGVYCSTLVDGGTATCSPPSNFGDTFTFETYCQWGHGGTFGSYTVYFEVASNPSGPWTTIDQQQSFPGVNFPEGQISYSNVFVESSIPPQYTWYRMRLHGYARCYGGSGSCELAGETPATLICSYLTLTSHLTWQGIPQPDARNQGITGTLALCSAGTPYNYTATTDASGYFTTTTDLPRGTYDWWFKGPKWLATSGTSGPPGELGTQRAGDANDSNIVSIMDFDILKVEFGSNGSNLSADFNNDGTVNIQDFNLQKTNFGQGGATPNCSSRR